MNYYPFHIGDYLSATRHLSWEEDAAYRRLLDTYYTHEKPLPAELRAVCRLVLATTEGQREAVATVLQEFFELTAEGWVNHRADAEIAAMREKQQKQREKANKRWQKQSTEPGNAPAMPQHESADAVASKTDADAMPPTPTPTPNISKPIGLDNKRVRAAVLAARPDSVSEETWADFLAIRKAKNAPLTPTALDGIKRECQKAGLSLAEALAICCTRGWQSFKAEWARDDRAGPSARRMPARENFDAVQYGETGLL